MGFLLHQAITGTDLWLTEPAEQCSMKIQIHIASHVLIVYQLDLNLVFIVSADVHK